jgi:hypothetical protein
MVVRIGHHGCRGMQKQFEQREGSISEGLESRKSVLSLYGDIEKGQHHSQLAVTTSYRPQSKICLLRPGV